MAGYSVRHYLMRQKPQLKLNYKLDDLTAGFEIAEAYWIGHDWLAKIQHDVGQGGLI
jgi:hypothetical protein